MDIGKVKLWAFGQGVDLSRSISIMIDMWDSVSVEAILGVQLAVFNETLVGLGDNYDFQKMQQPPPKYYSGMKNISKNV